MLFEALGFAPSPGPPSPEEEPTPTTSPNAEVEVKAGVGGVFPESGEISSEVLARCSPGAKPVLAPYSPGAGTVLAPVLPGSCTGLCGGGSWESGSLTWQCWCLSKVRIWIRCFPAA